MTDPERARLLALVEEWQARYEECRAAAMQAFTNHDFGGERLCHIEGSAVYRCKAELAALLPPVGQEEPQ